MNSLPRRSAGSLDPGPAVDSTDRLHEWVVSHIVPFFLSSAGDDDAPAREAARRMLTCYDTVTGKELQLAAQIVALEWPCWAAWDVR
jgi:hypothetical protein